MALFSRHRTIVHTNSIKHCSLATLSFRSAVNKKEKKRDSTLTLLKSESNPEKIVNICRTASLNPDSHHDRLSLSVAISKLSKADHVHGIWKILEEIKTRPEYRRSERMIGHLIVLYGRANMPDHATRTFMEISKYELRHSVDSLNALLFSTLLANNYKEVKRIFLEFPKIYRIKPNVETYNRVINAFCESGDSHSVYSILYEMDRKFIKPNATTFALWITGLYKEEKYEDVNKVLQIMEKYHIKSEVTVYNVRIQSLCKIKKSAEAQELLDEMISRGLKPNSVSYTQLIYGFCKEGKLEKAKKLFKKMINAGLNPDSNCFFLLVSFLCHDGDYETALKVCKQSMEKGWVPPFSNMKSLVIGLVSISKVAEAKKLIRFVKEKFPDDADMWNEIEAGLPQE